MTVSTFAHGGLMYHACSGLCNQLRLYQFAVDITEADTPSGMGCLIICLLMICWYLSRVHCCNHKSCDSNFTISGHGLWSQGVYRCTS